MKFTNDLNCCVIPRSAIRVTGKDRVRVINNFFTNQIDGLGIESGAAPGVEGLFTNAKGRIHAHAYVYVFEDHILIETDSNASESLVAHIDQYVISEDVDFVPCFGQTGECLALYGNPESVASKHEIDDNMSRSFIEKTGDQVFYRNVNSSMGFPTIIHLGTAEKVEETIQVYVNQGVTVRNVEEFEQDRVSAGIPVFGHDYSDANFPQELARDDDLISFTKGCYLGQETVARIDSLGHVNKFVRHISLESDHEFADLPVELTDPQNGDKKVGTITSVASSSDNSWQAIATLRVPYHTSGKQTDTNIGKVTVL